MTCPAKWRGELRPCQTKDLEPTVHRNPLPIALYRAMVAVAAFAGDLAFAGVLIIAFHGIARIGEPLSAWRECLVLPSDMMQICNMKYKLLNTDQ